jgi:hypothetical protein
MKEVAMRTALIACLALTFTGCYATNTQRGEDQRRHATVKIVDAKSPPATLIAIDRSVCLVTVNRYRDTRIGDAVYCHWQGGESGVVGLVAPAGVDDAPPGAPRSALPDGQP